MGLRGPKPGQYRYQRIPARSAGAAKPAPSPTFTMGIPRCPDGLSAAAKKVWKRVVNELHTAGILATVDAEFVEEYCNAVVEVRAITRTIDAEGVAVRVPVKDRHGVPTGEYVTQPHPMLKAKDSRVSRMLQLAALLGIGAASRAKANGSAPAAEAERPNKVIDLRDRIAAHRAAQRLDATGVN